MEAINTKVTDNQRMFTRIFYRFHVSQDLTIGDVAETIKFRINCQIADPKEKIVTKDRIVIFNDNVSIAESTEIRDLYI